MCDEKRFIGKSKFNENVKCTQAMRGCDTVDDEDSEEPPAKKITQTYDVIA